MAGNSRELGRGERSSSRGKIVGVGGITLLVSLSIDAAEKSAHNISSSALSRIVTKTHWRDRLINDVSLPWN